MKYLLGLLTMILLALPLVRAQDEKEKEPEKPPAKEKGNAEKDKQAMEDLLFRAEEEYRRFFRKPEKTHEFWAAIRFEMNVGKFDLAALHLKQLLAKEPAADVDKDLLKIEEVRGMSEFLRLQAVKKWSDIGDFQRETEKNVGKLIDRVTAALKAHLRDAVRIGKLIEQLDAPTIQERSYAFGQLRRSGAAAAPHLIKTLREKFDSPLHGRAVEALLKLEPDVVPGFLEILKAKDDRDAADPELRLVLLDVVKARADKRAIPYLWHMSASPKYPRLVRERARATLAYLMETDPARLPPAHMALTQLADDYYRHKIKFVEVSPNYSAKVKGGPIPRAALGRTVWPWDGTKVAAGLFLNSKQLEELYGLRHAREALDLMPTYQPAQIALLNLILEHYYAPELEKATLEAMPPSLKKLLASVDADVLIRVLDRALDDGNPRAALAVIEILGERGEVRAARLSAAGAPQGLVKALFHPDRRVQMAAARAMVRLPAGPVPVASQRVVDILRRFLAAGPAPRALVLYAPADKAVAARAAVKEAGFDPVMTDRVKEAFEHLHRAADVDAILVFPNAPAGELPHVLTQLREDRDTARLPLVVLSTAANEETLLRMTKSFPHTRVLPRPLATRADDIKATVEDMTRHAAGARLTDKERETFRKTAMNLLWRMAQGEVPGYEVRHARDAILQTANAKDADLATLAVETMGRLPGSEYQQRLAGMVLDPGRDKLRVAAARELNRHIQKFGLSVSDQQIKDLRGAYRDAAVEPELRGQLALVMGSLRPASRVTGARLLDFRPDAPAPKKEVEKK
ncbi:MAG: hypothetical protein FJ271_23095 [Planctomycetes bacterium]|nr:hypothetical protein [Planctomycetota bacterium]